MRKSSKIFVAGHKGLVGSAIVRELNAQGFNNIVTRTRKQLDLTDQKLTEEFFNSTSIDYVFDAAAKVGGIYANDHHSADFIYQNIQIQNNLIHNSWKYGVKKFLFLGSVCIYPKLAKHPIKEDALLTGALEPTNDAYAIAKISGIKMLQAYYKQYGFESVCLQPSNIYGPNDNFDPQNGHVIPAMISKFKNVKEDKLIFWGEGSQKREFLYSDDLALACVFAMENFGKSELVNVGSGENISIKDLAAKISKIMKYKGEIEWDSSRPNGTENRPLDSSRILNAGWKPKIGLDQGLRLTVEWFSYNYA
jgi:GDP-L-fucose synthase